MGKLGSKDIIRILCAFLFISACAAAYFTLLTENADYGKLITDLSVYVDAITPQSDTLLYFAGRFVAYAVPIAMIWFAAFVPPFSIVAFAILFIRIYGLAFTVISLWNARGASGIIYAIVLCAPQNIIWLPVFVYVTSGCIYYSIRRVYAQLQDYSFRLLAGMLASAGAALVETWVTPLLLKYIYLL